MFIPLYKNGAWSGTPISHVVEDFLVSLDEAKMSYFTKLPHISHKPGARFVCTIPKDFESKLLCHLDNTLLVYPYTEVENRRYIMGDFLLAGVIFYAVYNIPRDVAILSVTMLPK